MKLERANTLYVRKTRFASAAARQLAFGGIAVVWILASNGDVVRVDDDALRVPLLAFILALGLDIVHYYIAAFLWGVFYRLKEIMGASFADEIGKAPRGINWISNSCFWLKGLAVFVGYYQLGKLLWPELSP